MPGALRGTPASGEWLTETPGGLFVKMNGDPAFLQNLLIRVTGKDNLNVGMMCPRLLQGRGP